MTEWFESIAGPGYVPAMMWTIGALVLLLIVLLVIKIVRNLTFGTFVAGGRTRKTRLAVMDATAVDSQRRLVLVRRDDVEHLILVGGPTDVVVEQNIRLSAPSLRPQVDPAPSVPAREAAAPQPAEPPVAPPVQPRNPPRAEDVTPPPQPVVHRPVPEPVAARPSPAVSPRPPAAPPVQAAPPIAPPVSATAPDADDSLLNELEATLDRARTPDRSTPVQPRTAPPVAAPSAPPVVSPPAGNSAPQRQNEVDSLEDEMTRLLGEIRGTRR